jgi:RND family efflux transporter MFP subunit
MDKWLSSRRLLLLGAVVAVGLLVPLWWGREPAPSVRIAEARVAPLVLEVATNGKVEPIEDIEIRARFDGRVLEIPDAGKRVRLGDEVLRLDAGPVSAALEAARSEQLAARESLRSARAERTRAQQLLATDEELFRKGALTRARFEERQAAAQEAAKHADFLEDDVPLRIGSLDLRISDLEAQIEAAIINAPVNGSVYRTNAKRGTMVHVGDPIMWIANLERLRVRANVDQVDLGKVVANQAVRILSNAFPGRSWRGRVTDVVPHVKMKDNRAVSEALVVVEPPAEGLVPGMTVDVEIVVAEAEAALQVPAEAIFNNGSGQFVYRVDGSRVREASVQVGLASVSAAEVETGLEAGDFVVLGPVQGLRDGMRVDAQRSGAPQS